jgi:hypothetical protein
LACCFCRQGSGATKKDRVEYFSRGKIDQFVSRGGYGYAAGETAGF